MTFSRLRYLHYSLSVSRLSFLGRPRRKWENIKMDLREIRFGDVDWIHWALDRDR
jgi:hypothetical protein